MTYDPHSAAPVVVGVDGSDSAMQATRWAVTEAAARHTGLRLVCVVPDYERTRSHSDLDTRHAQQALSVAAAVAQTGNHLEVQTIVAVGQPSSVLLAQSESATMLVVGSTGVGFFPRMLLGSTAAALAAQAQCPIVLIRDTCQELPTTRRPRPVVVGVSGTHLDDALIGAGIHEARTRATHVLAVRAEYAFRPDPHARREAAAVDEFEEEIRGRSERWQTALPGVRVDALLTQGSPQAVLTTLSTHAQLVVVGSRGRGQVEGAVLGSTSQSLIYHGRCSILVYRECP
ncbi:universal stress protein [Rhodococcus sp. NPDC059234]|uniref:universal stress protein n=1 Tax=Rhodococcus sp. NPDC059234 TaxID=3346781 RepID=UPI00366DB822